MKFFKQLIEHSAVIINEADYTVEVDDNGTSIGAYNIFVRKFSLVANRPLSNADDTAAVLNHAKLSEINVGIRNQSTKEEYVADVYVNTPSYGSDVTAESVASADIQIHSASNGMGSSSITKMDDAELEEYLVQIVRGYLIKNVESIIDGIIDGYNNPGDEEVINKRFPNGYEPVDNDV